MANTDTGAITGNVVLPGGADANRRAQVWRTPDGKKYAAYQLSVNPAQTGDQWLLFTLSGSENISRLYWAGGGEYGVPAEQLQLGNVHMAGASGQAFANWDLNKDPSFQGYFQEQLELQVRNPEARNDPGVIAAIAKKAARVDMTDAELQLLLEDTDWWRKHNDQQRRWNDASPEEQQYQIEQMALTVQKAWVDTVGGAPTLDDPNLQSWAKKLASGEETQGAMFRSFQETALADANSPYALTVLQRQRATRQEDVDTENLARELKQQYLDWGVQTNDDYLKAKALEIRDNKASMMDVENELKDISERLYVGKPRDMKTNTWAQPLLSTFQNTMETQADLFNPQIQSALTAGVPAYEFEKQLKQSTAWQDTKNGTETITGVAGKLASKMGFN